MEALVLDQAILFEILSRFPAARKTLGKKMTQAVLYDRTAPAWKALEVEAGEEVMASVVTAIALSLSTGKPDSTQNFTPTVKFPGLEPRIHTYKRGNLISSCTFYVLRF